MEIRRCRRDADGNSENVAEADRSSDGSFRERVRDFRVHVHANDANSPAPRAPPQDEACATNAKPRLVIRVPIPIDIGTITASASGVFARATPLRIDRLLVLAILEALGPRAPQDKRDRAIRTALAGFRTKCFSIDVDGRLYDDPSDVIVCADAVTLRFFAKRGAAKTR